MTEKHSVDETAEAYFDHIINGWENLYREKRKRLYELIRDYFWGSSVLEMGVADGNITQYLFTHFPKVTVIDASEKFLGIIRDKFSEYGITIIRTYFEDYQPSTQYDTILMTHILEHLGDPVLVLRKAYDWLSDGGRVIISVPNANSLHRQIGVKMGMLPSCESLNEQDIILGHRRIYTPSLLHEHIAMTNFNVIKFTGLMLKNLSNRQIEQSWSPELIDAHFQLGFDYPELCSEIIYVLQK